MEDEDTHGKKMARKGRTEVIYKGTFVSKQSLASIYDSELTLTAGLLSFNKFFEHAI